MNYKHGQTTDSVFVSIYRRFTQPLLAVLCLVVLAALHGCGGSVSEAENALLQDDQIDTEEPIPTPPSGPALSGDELNQLPKVEVGARQFADANVLVTLNGIVEAAAGAEIVRTLWIQTGGTPVRIADPSATRTMIVVPDVVTSGQLEFRLFAEDNMGRVNSAGTSVVVVPQPVFARVIGTVVNEADGVAVFRVRLSAPATEQIVMSYRTVEGSALVESDFLPVEGVLTFEPGDQEMEVSVTLVADPEPEELKTFSLQISYSLADSSFSNSGVAVIYDGVESALSQIIQFEEAGPLEMLIDGTLINVIVDDPELAPGSGAVSYTSSDETVALVDASGAVIPVGPGTATITAVKAADLEYASATASYQLTVSLLPQSIAFITDSLTVSLGLSGSNPLDTEVISPGTGEVVYASLDPLVATVDEFGLVTGIAEGTTTITVTKEADSLYGEATASYELTVVGLLPRTVFFVQPDMTVGMNGGVASNPLAESSLLNLDATITYESSDTAIATVDGSGIVTGGAQTGTVTITASVEPDDVYQGSSATYELTVVESNTPFLEAYIKASNAEAGDQFGGSVGNRGMDMDGDVLIVGAAFEDSFSQGTPEEGNNSMTDAGAAYIFRRDPVGQWRQEAFLKASNTDFGDAFGYDVAISGDVAVVGAPFSMSGQGAVYVFRYDPNLSTWSAPEQIVPPADVAGFGLNVVIGSDGNVIAVSAPTVDQVAQPSVYLYRFNGASWEEETTLTGDNTERGDNFGVSLAMEGDMLVVGAPLEGSALSGINSGDGSDNDATDSGAVYIFERLDGTWRQTYYIKHENNAPGIQMGMDVALEGRYLAIADDSDTNDNGIGYRIYIQDNGVWTPGTQVLFGESIALHGDRLVIARVDSEVFISRLNQENQFTPINSIPAQGGGFARTLAISGDIVVVGAPLDATASTGIETIIPTDAEAPQSGAVQAYCIELLNGCAPPQG